MTGSCVWLPAKKAQTTLLLAIYRAPKTTGTITSSRCDLTPNSTSSHETHNSGWHFALQIMLLVHYSGEFPPHTIKDTRFCMISQKGTFSNYICVSLILSNIYVKFWFFFSAASKKRFHLCSSLTLYSINKRKYQDCLVLRVRACLSQYEAVKMCHLNKTHMAGVMTHFTLIVLRIYIDNKWMEMALHCTGNQVCREQELGSIGTTTDKCFITVAMVTSHSVKFPGILYIQKYI